MPLERRKFRWKKDIETEAGSFFNGKKEGREEGREREKSRGKEVGGRGAGNDWVGK